MDSAEKLYLVGAKSQAANPQTYSNSQVFMTNGTLTAPEVTLAKEIPTGTIITPTKVNFKTSAYNLDEPSYIGGDGLGIEIGVKGSSTSAFDVYSFFHGGSIKWTDKGSHQWLYSLPNKSGTLALLSDIPDAYTKTESDGKYVPYTGASKDVNLGNHSLLISNKTGYHGTGIKVSGKGVSEDDTSITIEPGNITLAGAGDDTTILNNSGFKAQIRADTDGDGQLDTTYYSMYEYGGIIHNDKTLLFPEKGGTLAVTDDLSTLLDKGTPSTAVNQIVYNPVEMKKNLTVPSLSGEKTTIAGNSISTFGLGGTKDGSTAMSDLTLVGFSGTSSINNVYTTHIQQLGDGTFRIAQLRGENVLGTLTYDGQWCINDYAILTDENLKKATNTYLGLIKPWYSTTGASIYNGSSTAPSAGSDTPNINLRSTTTGRYYAVEMDANGRAYVNVPWPDSTVVYDYGHYAYGEKGSWRIYQQSAPGNNLDIRYGVITITSQSANYDVSFAKSFTSTNYTVVFGLYRQNKQNWFWSPIVQAKDMSGFKVFVQGNTREDNGGTLMYLAIRSN